MEKQTVRILLVGLNPSRFVGRRMSLERGLEQACEEEWRIEAFRAPTFEYVGSMIALLKTMPPFEIIYISNQTEMTYQQLLKGCEELARAVAKLPKKPQIVFETPGHNLLLGTVFTSVGLEPRFGPLLDIVVARWKAQQPLQL